MNGKDSIFISVIIPVYQAGRTLKACTESVLAAVEHCPGSSDGGYELILVDDGSTDDSPVICDHIDHPLCQCLALHVPNGGVSRARNLGLSRARGEYIAFIDADDTVAEDFFSHFRDALEAHPGLDIYATSDRAGIDAPLVVSGDEFIEGVVLEEDTHVWGKLFRRTAALSHSFREGLTIGEDALYLLELSLDIGTSPGICLIPGLRYRYTYNEEGAMLRPYTPSYLDQLTCWEEASALLSGVNRRLSPYIHVRLSVIQAMSAFLVLGKAALSPEGTVPADDRAVMIQRCDRLLNRALRVRGCFAGLSAGYRIKVLLYRLMGPEGYMKWYYRHKKKR